MSESAFMANEVNDPYQDFEDEGDAFLNITEFIDNIALVSSATTATTTVTTTITTTTTFPHGESVQSIPKVYTVRIQL